jgi:hypothetical protein
MHAYIHIHTYIPAFTCVKETFLFDFTFYQDLGLLRLFSVTKNALLCLYFASNMNELITITHRCLES